ncbi:MAG: hypothetical protein IPI67_08120 [Myxococcales bacterium]|nr:hypothetical protein [Myxococcales bacterium]
MAYIHHLVVHFAISLAVIAAPCWLIAWRRQGDWLPAARGLALAAAAASVIAAASGLLSASHVIEMGGDPERIAIHRNLALGGAAVMLLTAVLSFLDSRRDAKRWLTVAASVLAATGLSVGAHFGADMLHPGLAPWSREPHHHGPSTRAAQLAHPDEGPLDRAPAAPAASAPAAISATAPAASGSSPPAAPPHDHSQHRH